ncbi:hypothetical protein HMPREF0063_12920 [Aeromicrobium marinum DSM 15272]|uniref:DUF4333 domain-containing protein n=1 Tax=Aeromicrobium marinum DSM 15272 TaxID=585531 RepID=E2SFW1_9ACTN|nr:hypothetical protein [Aeromicrobium marinum]EFQ81908.1 hypothetical protein HMPREF0063_12920 [Aeromicrobium marinum DSM 15272]
MKILLVPVTLLALTLAACGDDPVDVPVASDTSESGGAGAPTSLGDIDTGLDTLGFALETAMGNVAGYSVDGTTLKIRVEESSELSSACLIISTVVSSLTVPDGTSVEVEFDDGTEVCDL